jgi:hypothetical protein
LPAGNTADLTLGANASDQLVSNTHLFPSATNTLDLGATGTRWRKAWLTDIDLSGSAVHANRLTVAGVTQPRISVQSSAPSSPATGDLWIW